MGFTAFRLKQFGAGLCGSVMNSQPLVYQNKRAATATRFQPVNKSSPVSNKKV